MHHGQRKYTGMRSGTDRARNEGEKQGPAMSRLMASAESAVALQKEDLFDSTHGSLMHIGHPWHFTKAIRTLPPESRIENVP